MISTASDANLFITFGVIGLFLAGMIAVLYATNRESTSFSDYAVGGRSYGRGTSPCVTPTRGGRARPLPRFSP